MILLQDSLTIKVGGVSIYHTGSLYEDYHIPAKIASGEVVPLPKLVFDPDAAVGLDGIPSMRRDNTPRPTSHGVFSENGFTEGRIISLSGHAIAENPIQLQALRDTLASRLNTGRLINIEILRSDPSLYRTTQGYLEGNLDWTRVLDNYAQWKFDILCPDPRMYGREKMIEVRTSDTSIEAGLGYNIAYPLTYARKNVPVRSSTLTNAGNSPAYLRFEVPGPHEGFVIKDNSARVKQIRYSAAEPASGKLIIDTYKGVVTAPNVSNSDKSFLLTQRDWMTIPAKTGSALGSLNVYIDYVNSPTSASARVEDSLVMRVYFRDTWI